MVAGVPDDSQWPLPPGIYALVKSPLTLYQDWSMWPAEYSGNEGVWLLRLGHKRHGHFHLDLLEHLLGKASCHIMRLFKQICGGGPHGEGLRYPANSQYWVVCQSREEAILKVDPPAFSQASDHDILLQLHEEPWAGAPSLASLEILIHRNYGIVNAYCFK